MWTRYVWFAAMGVAAAVAEVAVAQPARCDSEWKLVTSGVSRVWGAGAWDPRSERFRMYGGFDEIGLWSPETWEFDGKKWVRVGQNLPALATLQQAAGAAMAFDPARQRMCLAAIGFVDPEKNSIGWLYEWENERWVPKTKLPWSSLSTNDVTLHLVYDYAAGKLLLADGRTAGYWYENGGWTKCWTDDQNSGRRLHRAVADPERKKAIFLGEYSAHALSNREWGNGWSLLPALPSFVPNSTSQVIPTWGIASFYSPEERGAVIFGGDAGWSGPPASSPALSYASHYGAVWDGVSLRALTGSPVCRGATAVYDAANRRGLAHGGITPWSARRPSFETVYPTGDIQAYQGGVWTSLYSPPAQCDTVSQPARDSSVAFDPDTGDLLVPAVYQWNERPLSTQILARQSRWNGETWRAEALDLGGDAPQPGSSGVQTVVDEAGGRVILIAPVRVSGISDWRLGTYEMKGGTWKRIALSSIWIDWPVLFYNSSRGKVSALNWESGEGIWELSGSVWTKIHTARTPVSASMARVIDDRSRQRLLLQNTEGTEFYEWSGSAWVLKQTSVPFASFHPLLNCVVAAAGPALPYPSVPGHPYFQWTGLTKWDGATWAAIPGIISHPADLGKIFKDEKSGKWYSYSGAPRFDIWELVAADGARFSEQPEARISTPGRVTSFDVRARTGMSTATYRWRCDGVPITTTGLPGVGTITGFTTPTLVVNPGVIGTFRFDCVLTLGGCGDFISEGASLTVSCAGDLNGDGIVDDADFAVFVACYDDYFTPPDRPACRLNDVAAVTDDADFVVFLAAYDRGVCP